MSIVYVKKGVKPGKASHYHESASCRGLKAQKTPELVIPRDLHHVQLAGFRPCAYCTLPHQATTPQRSAIP